MTYPHELYRQQPKIPTILSLVVVLAVVLFLAKLFGTKPSPSSASPTSLRQMQVSNLAASQAGIFWQTSQKSIDWVIYGESAENLETIVLDDRDIPDRKTPYLNHLVILKNLKENHTYFFKIVSGNKLIGDLQNRPFVFKTSSTLNASSNLKPAYGRVLARNGSPLENAVVLVTAPGAYPQVTMTKASGDWLVPLNNVIDSSTGKPKLIAPDERIRIEMYSEEEEKTTIEATISQLSPIPQTIIIGKDYSFTSQTNVLSATTGSGVGGRAEILFPKEGAVIPGLRPLIKGTAAPGSEVIVIINSAKSYSYRTTADSDGVWRVEVLDNLPLGEHTLTVTTKDNQGQSLDLTRTFTIAKSGEQVLGTATPEATPIASASPTLSSYLTPTSTSSAKPPVTGPSPLLYLVTSGSLIVFGLGLLLAF